MSRSTARSASSGSAISRAAHRGMFRPPWQRSWSRGSMSSSGKLDALLGRSHRLVATDSVDPPDLDRRHRARRSRRGGRGIPGHPLSSATRITPTPRGFARRTRSRVRQGRRTVRAGRTGTRDRRGTRHVDSPSMTYIIGETCIDIKDRSCVDVCPVDCIHEADRMLVIDPEECIDCAGEPECPVEAIFPEDAPREVGALHQDQLRLRPGPRRRQHARRGLRDRARRPEPAAGPALAVRAGARRLLRAVALLRARRPSSAAPSRTRRLGLLPLPGPFDEAVLLLVGLILWVFYRDSLRRAWGQAATPASA